jgi:SAM-dependent methyltransferase
VDAQLLRVQQHIPVGVNPPPLTGFRGVSRVFARVVARCVQYLANVVTFEQRTFNEATFDALTGLHGRVERVEAAGREAVEHVRDDLKRQAAVLQRHGVLLEEGEVALDGQHTVIEMLCHELEGVKSRQQAAVEALRQEVHAALEAMRREQEEAAGKAARLAQRIQWLHLDLLREQRRRAAPGGGEPPGEPAAPTPPGESVASAGAAMDRLYAEFEDVFRGSREEIKERLRAYLPLLGDAGIGTEAMPVLDVGCGRGEWLELLQEHGLHVRGIDINALFLQQCRDRGLAVAAADALGHLRGLPPTSLGAVTAFHVVEHLPFPALLEFFDQTVRVLKPGGLALFETPNPENILVGACTFWADPTHQRPLFGPTLQFLAGQRGLDRVEIRPMNQPAANGPHAVNLDGVPPGSRRLLHVLAHHVLAAPDYALIGWKT